jgi:hypothetical protein
MDPFAISHFSDDALLYDAKRLLGQGFMTDAMLLTRITEIDRRQLYRREGYPSMYSYMIQEWHLTEDAAYKRIHAARAAQRFPGVLIALAEGRLHMRGVLMLAHRLTSANADELVAAATHKSRFEIQQLLAERFPQPDLPERLQAIGSPPLTTALQPSSGAVGQLAPEQVQVTIPERPAHAQADALLPEPTRTQVPERMQPPDPAQRVTPLAPQRFGFQCTFDQETHELLQDLRALMSHEIPNGEMALVIKGALKLAKAELLKRKFAATERPAHSRGCASTRRIPAAVKRAVWERDGGRCTFVSESGRRCQERARLELDHIEPVARGGESTVENVRLACRSHNQYAAECAFGAEFMERKRAEALHAGCRPRAEAAAPARAIRGAPSDAASRIDTSRSTA